MVKASDVTVATKIVVAIITNALTTDGKLIADILNKISPTAIPFIKPCLIDS